MKENTIDPAFAAMAEPEPAKEIAPGMTVEEMRAVYFNADALKEPAYRVYQLNSDGHRYYYRFNEAGEPEFYPSVTTLLKQVMPTPPALIDWMIANGKDGSVEKRDLAAHYGTFMHIQFERLIINRRYDFDSVPAALLDYMERENLPEKFLTENLTKARKDVLAFAQFVRDYNVKPLAIEIALVHPDYHFAGCLDLPCVMTDPKTAKTFTAIVDFKSGRKGFFEEHELQLHLYRMMWNVNYPETPVERLFNFSPKDWRGAKPTYNLKDQTDSVNAAKLPHLLALAAIEDEKRDNTLTIVRGVLDLDKGKIADNILTLSLAELIKSKQAEKTPEEYRISAEEFRESAETDPNVLEQDAHTAAFIDNLPFMGPKRADFIQPAPTESAETRETAQKRTRKTKADKDTAEPVKAPKTENAAKLTDDFVQNHFPWENPNGVAPASAPEPAPEPMENLLNFEMEL